MPQSVDKVMQVISQLLGPDGCPWDKKQTPESLCDYFVEETFELVDAIRSGDIEEARGEIGDVMFLVLFVARLFEDQGHFSLDDAMEHIAAKMIRRHPHVFADLKIDNQEELLRNWERIKRNEKNESDTEEGPKPLYASLPKGLPPMVKAYRIHSKAARVGFTWESDADVEAHLRQEWNEWQEALASGTAEEQEREFGDYLFTLIELGRRKGIKANAALDMSNQTFLARYDILETMARRQGKDPSEMTLDELNGLWDQAKAELAAK